jgi:hypothetical protein
LNAQRKYARIEIETQGPRRHGAATRRPAKLIRVRNRRPNGALRGDENKAPRQADTDGCGALKASQIAAFVYAERLAVFILINPFSDEAAVA